MNKLAIWLSTGVLLFYFAFTSGVVYEATRSNVMDKLVVPFSLALSGERTGLVGIYTDDDIRCVEWLAKNRDSNIPIVGDYNISHLMRSFVSDANEMIPSILEKEQYEQCYIVVRAWNFQHQEYIFSLRAMSGRGEGLRVSRPLSSIDATSWQELFRSGDSVVYKRKAAN
jgi:uncharacterized membrane protein